MIYAFEEIGPDLPRPPMAARRALLGAGVSMPLDTWQTKGGKDLYVRAADRYRDLRATLAPLDLPDDVKRDMDKVVKSADEHLVG